MYVRNRYVPYIHTTYLYMYLLKFILTNYVIRHTYLPDTNCTAVPKLLITERCELSEGYSAVIQ